MVPFLLILLITTFLCTIIIIRIFSKKRKEENTSAEPLFKEYDEFDNYPFLRIASEDEVKAIPNECHGVHFVYCQKSNTHYVIQKDFLHDDEQKLSELRVKLYEQSKLSANEPLLVCSSCKRPVYLSGNPGIKGQIVGFCHENESYLYSGLTSDDYSQAPKPEDEDILNNLAHIFSCYRGTFDTFKREDSFLAIPGTDKSNAGDITCTLGQYKIAVIFISASHPLDFIIRRVRNAHKKGFIPIWIVSKDLIFNHGMSIRDISAFSGGYVCSIDENAINHFEESGNMTLFASFVCDGSELYIPIEKYFEDASNNLLKILEENTVVRRNRVSKIDKKNITKEDNITININSDSGINKIGIEGAQQEIVPVLPHPRPKMLISAVHYWEGYRIHIKSDLYVEKVGKKYGVLNLKTNRYPILPIFDNIEIAEDKNTIITYLDGKEDILQI